MVGTRVIIVMLETLAAFWATTFYIVMNNYFKIKQEKSSLLISHKYYLVGNGCTYNNYVIIYKHRFWCDMYRENVDYENIKKNQY